VPAYGIPNGVSCAGACATPLEIELIDFDAKRNDKNSVFVNWTTKSEENNNFFAIERSIDGKNFEEIGSVSGAGSSSLTHYYNFIDNEPFFSGSYYRVKQVDFDWTYTYSKVKYVPFGASCDYRIYADYYSNKINVQSGVCDLSGLVTVEVYDASGRRVISKSEKSRSSMMEVETGGLPKGIYFVNVRNGITNYKQKIIIQ